MLRRTCTAVLAGIFAVFASFLSFAGSEFEGVWKVQDTTGKPFEITLSGDSTAKADLRPDMVGTWKEDGASAVISWTTGWTTRIMKANHRYTHSAYRPGQPLNSTPEHYSSAQKLNCVSCGDQSTSPR
jgi:hypothetical protein